MPLKPCTFLPAVALAAALVPAAAMAQPVPAPLPAPIERALSPQVVAPSAPTMRLEQVEEEAAYPGYYGWRTYAPSYYGLGVARPSFSDRPFYGFAYRPSGYTGLYRPFYYRHGFYFRGQPFGYVPFDRSYSH